MGTINILKNTRRRKNKKKKDSAGAWSKYRSPGATEYQRAVDRWLFGTLGAASPVRKIDPTTDEAYRDAAAKTRQSGASMIFVVTPVFSQSRLQFRQPPPPEPLLSFNNSKTYPQLYDVAARVDDGHLSEEGAEMFTRLLAQEFVSKTGQR